MILSNLAHLRGLRMTPLEGGLVGRNQAFLQGTHGVPERVCISLCGPLDTSVHAAENDLELVSGKFDFHISPRVVGGISAPRKTWGPGEPGNTGHHEIEFSARSRSAAKRPYQFLT